MKNHLNLFNNRALKAYAMSFLLMTGVILMASCGGDDSPEVTEEELVNPNDVNALSRILILPGNATSQTGNPPPPSGSNAAPVIENMTGAIISSNGSTAPLNFEYGNVGNNLAGCYVQVDGAGAFYNIPYNSISSNSGEIELPVGIPTNVDGGEFVLNYCVYDQDGLISNVISVPVRVLRLGTGAVQVSLSWNNDSDQDLYVTDPSGETISYLNEVASSGGELDRDDTDGYGPENIFWSENAPDGQYVVQVNDFDERSEPTIIYVTVSGPNGSRSFESETVNGNTVTVVSFTKSGVNLLF